ncbi:MAG: macro domain-containing protein [Candidatus Odinarchaeota archaeon]|nr:macro domain-containing protein [Candidatus Odinarchaeota archaeon]
MSFLYRIRINNSEIKVYFGDITKLNVDAIVNAANSLMIMGGGVAGAIKRAGGDIIEKEAMKQAPVPVGSAIYTTAGKLNIKYVVHTPTMERPAMRINQENVRKAIKAALKVAEDLKDVFSLAIPALGTGVGGVSKKDAAEIMINEILAFIKGGTKLREIILCDINKDQCNEFIKVLESVKDL